MIRNAVTRTLAVLAAGVVVVSAASAASDHHHVAAGHHKHRSSGAQTGTSSAGAPTLTSSVFAAGSAITHPGPNGAAEPVTKPDDITELAHHVYVAYQNGVGSQGQAATDGNKDSTIVEFDTHGHQLRQWDVTGKVDGLSGDSALNRVIASVNEDANSSLYLLNPNTTTPSQLQYSRPLPSNGGTDAITVYHRRILITASAPGTSGASAPQARYPAVYVATLHQAAHQVAVHPLFGDAAPAALANAGAKQGHKLKLALTDPDSNASVPAYAQRFAGDFLLTSQADEEQIFASSAGSAHQRLSVLKLSGSVDDTQWPSSSGGSLLAVDSDNNTIYRLTGHFTRGSELVATTPCDQSNAPSTCPGPGFPDNYLGVVSPQTGKITPVKVKGAAVAPHGLLYLR